MEKKEMKGGGGKFYFEENADKCWGEFEENADRCWARCQVFGEGAMSWKHGTIRTAFDSAQGALRLRSG
jgi:hypothetical protein